jgi:uncharacterized protein with HEPN domain
MLKEPLEYLKHIRDECSYILSVSENDFTKDKLIQDETIKRAIVRSLEIIGEATKKIPADYKIKRVLTIDRYKFVLKISKSIFFIYIPA